MKYPLTFYTTRLLPSNAAGGVRQIFIIPVILIRPDKRDDFGIYRHELTHVKQVFKTFFLFGFLYWIKEYRLACEVEAYKEQAKHYQDDRLPLFAWRIATKYNLPITEQAALALLTE